MELEFSIEDLLKAKRVEGNRIEFKAGWNPDDIYKSVCAGLTILIIKAAAISLLELKKSMELPNVQ